jgi:maestro heat-like repeat-containing protein family member 1
MAQYLEGMWTRGFPLTDRAVDNNETDKWEELVLRLLTESIKITNDDEWNVALGTAIVDQLPFYNKDPELKVWIPPLLCTLTRIMQKSAFKLLGMIMQKSGHKEFIRTKLDVMFASVDHTNTSESEGCAVGFGFCAATHLDIVLEKLQAVAKRTSLWEFYFFPNVFIEYMVKKSGGLFSFGSSKEKGTLTLMGGGKKVKNTILLSLGYVTSYAQPKYVLPFPPPYLPCLLFVLIAWLHHVLMFMLSHL